MNITSRNNLPKYLPAQKTQYCFCCGTEGVSPIEHEGRRLYHCTSCGLNAERYRVWDPVMKQHFNERDELVHESVGVVVKRDDGKVLLFLRTKFPFEWTLPAGHVEKQESPYQAAFRELHEETGITAETATLIFAGEIRGDSCVGGADIHYWSLYLVCVPSDTAVSIEREEGAKYNWFKPDSLPDNLTVPTQFLLNHPDVLPRLGAKR